MEIERLLKLKDTDQGKIEMIISNNLDLMYKGKACVTIDNWDKLTNEILAWHKYENEKLIITDVVASVVIDEEKVIKTNPLMIKKVFV